MPEFTAQDALDVIALRAKYLASIAGNEAFSDTHRSISLAKRDALMSVASEIASLMGPVEDKTLAGVESIGERAARHRSEIAGADLPTFPVKNWYGDFLDHGEVKL